MPEPLPVQIGKYPITRVLGEGGMGIVFLGRDPDTDRDVAVKTIKADLPEVIKVDIRPRFEREAKVGKLQHDNLVTLYTTGEWDGGRPYIAMEYIDGEALDKIMLDLLRSGRRLPLIEQLDIIRQVCEGLDYAHQNGIFHRDIKPANVMRRRDGRVKIVDFGIARVQNSLANTALTQPMQVIGTVAYMAPERLKGGRGDGPADIFAVGVLLYYLLTGQEPFTGAEAMSVMHKVVNEPYAPLNTHLPEYPAAIDQILELALAKDPAARYSRAQEFAADLAAIINDINRGRIPSLLQDAERLLNEGRWDLASEKADEITRIDPQNAKARDVSRKAGRGRRDEADEERVRVKIREANDFVAYGRYDQAIQVFEELVARKPGNLDFQTQLEDAKTKRRNQNLKVSRRAEALSLFESGDLTGAIHRYEELIALNPADEQLHEEYLKLKKDFEDQEQRSKTDRHIENAKQAVGAQRYTEAISIIEDIYKSKISRPDVDRLYQEALKGRKDKDDERFRDQVLIQARKLRSVEQYPEALAELDQGLLKLPGDTVILRLRSEIDRETKNTRLKGWIAETIEKVSLMALNAPDAALVELRQSMKELPGEERFELLESDLLRRIEESEAVQRRAVCLRESGEALSAGDPYRAKQIIQRYLLKYQSDGEIDRLFQEVQNLEDERELERRSADCEAQSRSLLDQGRFTEAISVLQPTLRETKNKRLARLLEEAERKKSEIDAITGRLGPRILALRQAGKQEDAIALIESQDALVLQNPVLQKILEELRKELSRNRALADAVSRSKQAVDSGEWTAAREPLDDVQRVFGDFEALTHAISQFNVYRTQLADKMVGDANESAKALILSRDEKSARKALEAAASVVEFASADVSAEWRRLAQSRKIDPLGPNPTPAQRPKFPPWAAAVAGLVLVVVGTALWKSLSIPSKPAGTYVQITKAPSGASVLIDGVTPVLTDENGQARVLVQPGHLSVKVSKGGFTSFSDDIDVDKGVVYSVSAKLIDTQTTGNLVAQGNADKFKLFVDNTLLGGNFKRGDRIPIEKGRHTIHYEAEGFEPSSDKDVVIAKGADLGDTFELKVRATSAAIFSFSANPNSVGSDGTEVTFRWRTSNATKASIEGLGDVQPNGEKTVKLNEARTYTLTVEGSDAKSVRRQVPITLVKQGAAFISSFTVQPPTAKPEDTVTLSWQTKDATEVSIDKVVGRQGPNGSARAVIPKDASGQFAFQMIATGKGGSTPQTAIVDIITPPPVIAATPVPVPQPVPVAAKSPAPAPVVPTAPAAFDPSVLRKALVNFESVFKSASIGDKKACTRAFGTLSSITSKGVVGSLNDFCDAATGFSGAHECGSSQPATTDDNTKATWSCSVTISFRLKDNGTSQSKTIPSSFEFAKNLADGSWRVVKWDPRM